MYYYNQKSCPNSSWIHHWQAETPTTFKTLSTMEDFWKVIIPLILMLFYSMKMHISSNCTTDVNKNIICSSQMALFLMACTGSSGTTTRASQKTRVWSTTRTSVGRPTSPATQSTQWVLFCPWGPAAWGLRLLQCLFSRQWGQVTIRTEEWHSVCKKHVYFE